MVWIACRMKGRGDKASRNLFDVQFRAGADASLIFRELIQPGAIHRCRERIEHLSNEIFLRPEVVADRRAVRTGMRGYVARRNAVDAACGEQEGRRVDEPRASISIIGGLASRLELFRRGL